MSTTSRRAYKAWIKRMDPNWKHNYPKWKSLSPQARRAWVVATEVYTELIWKQRP